MAGAVTASTFTTVAVFFPIVFVEGIAGQLFKDMALTVTFPLLASLVVSLTLVPMLNSGHAPERTQSKESAKAAQSSFSSPWIRSTINSISYLYKDSGCLIRTAEDHFDLCGSGLFLGIVFMIPVHGTGTDPGHFSGRIHDQRRVHARNLTQGKRRHRLGYLRDPERIRREIDSIYELIGKGSRGGISFQEERENLSEFTLRLKPGILGKKEDRIMDRVSADLEKFPTTKIKVYKPRLFSFKAPLEVVVSGNDLDLIKKVSD